MTASRQAQIELAAYVALALGLGLIQFTIKAEGFLILAGLLWLVLAITEGRRPDVPAFFVPLLVLAGWTLVSCAFSSDPVASFERSRQLLLFLIVPGVARLARGERATRTIDVIIAFGALAALVGIVQSVMLGYDTTANRPKGMLGHYMTYSGVLMLITCAAVARLVYRKRDWVWPAIAVPALVVALGATLSRNAWVGAIVAAGVLVALRNAKLLILAPILAAVVFVASPSQVKQRVHTMVDLNDPTNRDRMAMLEAGVHMVKDHPLFGVGMNMVPKVYPQYRTADAVDRADATGPETRSHLHNVPMQLAAERGLPALAAWLWFIVVAARDLYRQVRRGPAVSIAAAGLAALVAMLAAGLFEHNFGDSEFLILFLGLIALPYAAAHDRGDRLLTK
jgi:O-antigen ligase